MLGLIKFRFARCQSIIVYCTRRDECERVATFIRTCLQVINGKHCFCQFEMNYKNHFRMIYPELKPTIEKESGLTGMQRHIMLVWQHHVDEPFKMLS